MTDERNVSGQKSTSELKVRSTRRQLLTSIGVGSAVVLAGCSGEDTTGSDDEPATETEPTGPGDDVSDGAEPDQTEAGEGTAETGDETDPGADTSDPTDGTDTSDPTDGTDTSEPTDGTDTPTFADSVEMEGTMVDGEGRTIDLVGRRHDGDLYYEYTTDSSVSELYVIDDTYYTVTEDSCIRFEEDPDSQPTAADGGLQTDEFESETFWENREYTLETIDGMEMRVYEFELQSSSYTSDYTVYVNPQTNYVYRLDQVVPEENVSNVVYYDNWGNAAPISPPDRTCQTV